MRKFLVLVTAAMFVAGSVTSVSAAPWKFDGTQRFAGSHDGNGYDRDDIGASAFVWAICWSFGAVDKICHFEHSNNLCGQSPTGAQSIRMIAAVEGGCAHFGLGAGTGYGQLGIVYNFIANPGACVAHFKVESDKNTATNTIVEECAGPMESTWRNITATVQANRQYMTFVSHSSWNENFTGCGLMTHTWSSCKGIPGGAVFLDISDQNGKLGTGGGAAKWSGLNSIGTKNGKTQADWTWLYNTQAGGSPGDVSDAGMAFYIFTNNQSAGTTELVAQFSNPLGVAIQTPLFPAARLNDEKVNLTRSGSALTVSLTGSRDNGTVKVYNMMNRLVCSVPLSKGSAIVPMTSKSQGSYVINIQAGNRKIVKEYINR